MKKIIAAITALAMMVSMAACAKKEDPEQASDDSSVSTQSGDMGKDPAETEENNSGNTGESNETSGNDENVGSGGADTTVNDGEDTQMQTVLSFNAMVQGATATTLSDDVTMYQVAFTDEIIRDPIIDESHPEYIDVQGGDPYFCEMGIVFRNDRCLTIEVPDRNTGKTRTFAFGYITGECNRFLYLSPTCLEEGKVSSEAYYYVFDNPIGGGSILNIPDNTDLASSKSYVLDRTLQEVNNASYRAPDAPGVVWHTGGSITDPVHLDVRVYRASGDMVAILRLTLQMQNDGTYVLTNLENKDLLRNNEDSLYTDEELTYLVALARETYNDPDQVHFAVGITSNYEITEENCLIELRGSRTSLYYNTFIPRDGVETTRSYMGQGIDILAVTFRFPGINSQTFYYMVFAAPYENEHGIYSYIGRDDRSFDGVKEMTLRGTG